MPDRAHSVTLGSLIVASTCLSACWNVDFNPGTTGAGESDPSTSNVATSSPSTGDPSSSSGDRTTDGDASSDAVTSGDGDGDSDGDDPFIFDATLPSKLSQVDRMGMPALNILTISSKDQYNQDSPYGDAMGTYVDEIVTNVEGLHLALDDDLIALSLTPCLVSECVAQAAPLIVPDTLKLTLDAEAGYPNGRLLNDPVMDVILAVLLLDLTVHTAADLVGVNPPDNDIEFPISFPYLAPAN